MEKQREDERKAFICSAKFIEFCSDWIIKFFFTYLTDLHMVISFISLERNIGAVP